MLRLSEVKLPLDHSESDLDAAVRSHLAQIGVKGDGLVGFTVFRRAHDARKRDDIKLTYIIDIEVKDEAAAPTLAQREKLFDIVVARETAGKAAWLVYVGMLVVVNPKKHAYQTLKDLVDELKRRGVDKEIISSDGTCLVHDEFTAAIRRLIARKVEQGKTETVTPLEAEPDTGAREEGGKVVDLTEGAYTERELMLVKVRAVGKEREEMKRMADIFRGRIIDVTEKSYTLELTGDVSKNDAFLEAIDRSAILETVRTGACGIGRGERILRV